MAIPEDIINEIKYRNDIETAVSQYVTLKRRGKNLVGLCPFHGEKTPSFTVYPETASFYCFGCGLGGDVFTFTRLIENLDYMEAVKLLAERSGVTLPQDGYDDSLLRLKNRIYDINKETARFFHSYLLSDKGAWGREYLSVRGLSLATVKKFGLGAAPDSWDDLINHLKQKGYTIEEMLTANVIGKSQRGTYYDRFRKRIMFPIINIRGNVVGFSGRALPGEDKQGGKYVNTADTPVYKKSNNLFGINLAKSHCEEKIILVEGNIDVVTLHQAGFKNAVAPLGTSFTEEQAALLARYTKEIILTMDADTAGEKAVKRDCEILEKTGLKTRVVVMPKGMDPDDYVRKYGPDRFRGLIEGAVSDIEYKLLTAAKDIDLSADDGKLKYLSAAAEILAEQSDIMTRDIYIGRLSKKYGVSRTALETRVRELRRAVTKKQEKKEINDVLRPKYTKAQINPEKSISVKGTNAEETLIAVLLQHPDFYETALEKLPPDKMITSLNRKIYTIIGETLEKGAELDISVFGQRLQPAELGLLVSLQNSERALQNPKTVLNDCIKVILEEGLRLEMSRNTDNSVEEWAQRLQNIIDKKQKGN